MSNGFSFKTIEWEVGNPILGLVIIPPLKTHWRISPVIILEDSLVSFKVRSYLSVSIRSIVSYVVQYNQITVRFVAVSLKT